MQASGEMTKQDEIREGIIARIPYGVMCSSPRLLKEQSADAIIAYLTSQGVVLKVIKPEEAIGEGLPCNPYDTCELWDKELLIYRVGNNLITESGQKEGEYAYWASQVDMLKAGYTKTEDLI